MELLELLAQQKNCDYISDLKLLDRSKLCFPLLREIDFDAYPEKEWIEAASYLFNCKCMNGKDAKAILIGPKH